MARIKKTASQQSDNVHPSSAKKVKSSSKDIYATLLKKIRAAAAIVCLDHIFCQDNMKITDQQVMAFNCFHGNEDLNMASQVKMAFMGKGILSNLYIKDKVIVTDNNQTINDDDEYNRK